MPNAFVGAVALAPSTLDEPYERVLEHGCRRLDQAKACYAAFYFT